MPASLVSCFKIHSSKFALWTSEAWWILQVGINMSNAQPYHSQISLDICRKGKIIKEILCPFGKGQASCTVAATRALTARSGVFRDSWRVLLVPGGCQCFSFFFRSGMKVWTPLTIVVVFVLHGDVVAPRVGSTFPGFVIDLILAVWK